MQLNTLVSLEPFELTQVERLEAMETRAGIRISAVMATAEPEKRGKDRFSVQVMAEIETIDGQPLKQRVDVDAACYNAAGQICGSGTLFWEYKGFCGAKAAEHTIECKSRPVRLKLLCHLQPE